MEPNDRFTRVGIHYVMTQYYDTLLLGRIGDRIISMTEGLLSRGRLEYTSVLEDTFNYEIFRD